jgi:hypothetical protein
MSTRLVVQGHVFHVSRDAHQQAGIAASAANAAAVAAGREGVEAHVLEMLQATCSPTGKWGVKAAHLQQGGGMSLASFQLAAGRLRYTEQMMYVLFACVPFLVERDRDSVIRRSCKGPISPCDPVKLIDERCSLEDEL